VEDNPLPIIYTPSSSGTLRQGEIISDLAQASIQIETIYSDEPVIIYEDHPFAIIVTQYCDLTQDFKARQEQTNADKMLPNILFCQMVSAEELKRANNLNSSIWGRVSRNKDERYHFFQKIGPEQDALGKGLPELGVDFKRYFTLPADEVYHRLKSDARRRCCLASPYLEHFSTRFAYYQFRVALPEDHFSESP
jgi:hypothetical protein